MQTSRHSNSPTSVEPSESFESHEPTTSHRAVSSGAQKPFFIGIDSDGTAFDSMEIKHKRVFQPIAVEIWGLHPWLGDFYEIAELINLYSTHRGVNRFQGLAMAFERLSRKSAEARTALQGYDALRDFVLAGIPLSASSLADYNSNRKNKFLSQTLEWSQRCDQRYAQIMEDEGNPPYSPVTPTLQRAFPKTEVVVISSSSKETLLKDWGDAALLSLTDHVAGQENGIKPAQLKEALRGRHEPTRALMIGDAPGDLEAARASGILFYPILPGSEQASWQRLQSEALDRFFEGSYAGDYESALLSDFQSALIQGGAWPESDRS